MCKPEILEYLDGFRRSVAAPLREGVAVEHVSCKREGGFHVHTSAGSLTCDQLVVASGGYHSPIIPRMAERLPPSMTQVHSEHYRNADALPPGAVLVVGSGQSGAQIAEDLHLAGRKVFLAVGTAPRCARFYRGKDVVDWLSEMKYYDMPVTSHPLREGVRDNTNHYVTGRDGGRDIDLRRFALEGMELFGPLTGFTEGRLTFKAELRANLDQADQVYNGINAGIDKFIEKSGLAAPPASVYSPVWQPAAERTSLDLLSSGIQSIVWCIGFEPDFRWLDAPLFNGRGHPCHERGVTGVAGLYFIGLPWLHTWGSGRFSGVARDAQFLAGKIGSLARSPSTEMSL
jgi:putative flavoprotein involved in K+ transport